MCIKEFKSGHIYISKDYANKIFEYLENDDDESIQRLVDEGKVQEYESSEFTEDFIKDLESDLGTLTTIKSLWQNVKRDPKLLTFLDELSNGDTLQNKIIVFTESKETAEYLTKNINRLYSTQEKAFVFLALGKAAKISAGEDLKVAIHHLRSILEKIDNGEGTMGKLVNNASLYDNADQVFKGAKKSAITRKVVRHYKKKGEKE